MMSTPQDPKLSTSNSISGQGDSAPVQRSPHLGRLRFNSFGTKLFIAIMGGVLAGIGGTAFLFGETVKYQSEEQIRQVLTDNVHSFDGTLAQAEIFANTLRTSTLTLHARNVENPDTYRRLLFEAFKERPDFVVGVGMGQSENGLLSGEQWFFTHYQLHSGAPGEPGLQLSPPYEDIRFINETQPDSFYPETDRYQTYFLAQQATWASPEPEGALQATYYTPIATAQRWLGTVFVEINDTAFDAQINDPVLYGAGYMVLLTEAGQVVSAPETLAEEMADQNLAGETLADQNNTSLQSIPGLAAVWEQMTEPSGFIEGEQGYWAYERLNQNDWIAVAYVPYQAVFRSIALIIASGVLGAGLFIALIVILTVRSLNRRLRPILHECNRLAETDQTLAMQSHQDEIDQVTVAFFNLLSQLQANEARMRQEVIRTVKAEEQVKQAKIAEQESRTLQAEVSHLLQVVAAVEEGDLTVSAEVNPNVTGLLGDTLNRLIERLGQVMAIVWAGTERVTQGATQLEQLAVIVADNAQQQNRSVAQVQHLMERVNVLAQDTVAQAAIANDTMQSTQMELTQGNQEITTIAAGIQVLQQGANQILRRTQTLDSYMEQAAQFTKDQKRVAAMTRVLAVNATMLANRASMQQDPAQFMSITREFEQIAIQVNDLASQTNQNLIQLQQRTNQVETVVSGLEYDAQTIAAQANGFTAGVDQSRQVFQKIQAATQEVAQMGQQVTQSSQAIVEMVQATLQSIQTISAIAAETSSQSNITREQAQVMEQLAQLLLQKIAFFKVPPAVIQTQDLEQDLEQDLAPEEFPPLLMNGTLSNQTPLNSA
ncbi:methyl-accepting chemotaxis protein [Egbenema bharatensis]|uniref:methyl-accepting chemotaxis protein n=1 Tax=Egbenema bharatensis TaxID=3463334 RepID=UPI003A860A08